MGPHRIELLHFKMSRFMKLTYLISDILTRLSRPEIISSQSGQLFYLFFGDLLKVTVSRRYERIGVEGGDEDIIEGFDDLIVELGLELGLGVVA